jgi:hypothetical protein
VPTILLALDACTRLEHLLPAALLLASQQQAELLGMFAQDARLLQGAALPFTHEVGSNSAVCYPLTTDSIARRLQGIAEQMRRRLAAAAERRQLPWAFRICGGSIAQITSEAMAEVVLPGWSTNSSVATAHATSSIQRISAQSLIVVIDDGSPSSTRVIEAARSLKQTAGMDLLVIFTTPQAGGSLRTRPQWAVGAKPTERVIAVDSIDQLIRQIRMLHPTVMLLGRDQELAASDRLQKELALMKCPLALLRSTC